MEKIVFITNIKHIFENDWWEDAHPSSYPWTRHWPLAIETIKRIWHISVTWHHQAIALFSKKQSRKGEGHGLHGTMSPS